VTWHTFGRSTLFAAVAGAAWLPWVILVAPLLGISGARHAYLALVLAVYVAGLSRHPRVLAAFAVGAAGLAFAIVGRSTVDIALGLTLLLGVARSAFLHPSPASRAVVIEAILLGTGLLFARFLAGSASFSTALGVWGFFLVQSVFFLIGGKGAREASSGPDAFDQARDRALALLDRAPV
jgi:hypothetical protein